MKNNFHIYPLKKYLRLLFRKKIAKFRDDYAPQKKTNFLEDYEERQPQKG